MGLFGTKNKKSRLRFCQKAAELPSLWLFRSYDVRLAISRLTESFHSTGRPSQDAVAYGVVHDIYGSGQPLLPVSVTFAFNPPSGRGDDDQADELPDAGWGSVWKDEHADHPHYKAEFTIYDEGRKIYDRLVRAFEHGAISNHQFLHLHLRKQRPPFIKDLSERSKAEKAEQESVKALMRAVDAGTEELPTIRFKEVAFEDQLFLRAPAWSNQWVDDPSLDNPRYHDREAAVWRNRHWRRAETE
jgi:hypothetical protein